MLNFSVRLALAAAALSVATLRTNAAEPTPEQLQFFEGKIRPLFADNCYKCHSKSAGKIKGGLLLDSRDAVLKGGDSGTVLTPGDPEHSLLIKAVRYADENLQMPPSNSGGKLSAAQIIDLVAWVKMGAPDPRDNPDAPAVAKYPKADAKKHWAFQPVKKPAVPAAKAKASAPTPIDAFIVARLEEKNMVPSVPADQRTLIRRAYFDLIGLPPTPDEVEAFLQDPAPNAFEKVVDHLLESPHYGERWGRYWLDTARYSDTKGNFDRRRESSLYPFAWTYRDYVIRAFNEDKPYDRFIFEQLAGDKLAVGADKSTEAALGLLTLGDHFMGNQNDIINDRIDVVTKGFLGLTVACARCHDHMFDPIPTKDYYSLHGIFASSYEPKDKPLLKFVKPDESYQDYLKARAELDAKMTNVVRENIRSVLGNYYTNAATYLYATELSGKARTDYIKDHFLDSDYVKNWDMVLKMGARREPGTFGLWFVFSRIPDRNFAEQSRRITANLARSERAKTLNPHVLQAFQGAQINSMKDVAAIYGKLFAKADLQWQGTLETALHPFALRQLPVKARRSEAVMREQLDLFEMTHPGSPPRAEVLLDTARPGDSYVLIRGEAENKGDVAPRRFLEILSGPVRPVFTNGSGRAELARAIASKNNPLTARVLVNRVWLHHFGEGFVTTPDDFGTRSDPPSHPELLDYLAAQFMEQGWSIKKLHKQVMLSKAYQQSSQNNERYAELDPYNRLLWRANIRRLEFEPLRDSILYVGGKLDLTIGGRPVDLTQGQARGPRRLAGALRGPNAPKLSYATRRTVYGYIDRADLAEVFNHFDFASPDMTMGKRYQTTVPQQALFLMNSPLVIEQARNIINRDDFVTEITPEARVKTLYNLIYQRQPTTEEIKLGLQFVAQFPSGDKPAGGTADSSVERAGNDRNRPLRDRRPGPTRKPLTGWAEYAHALLLSNEATFVN